MSTAKALALPPKTHEPPNFSVMSADLQVRIEICSAT
jgi:hypothetical protein